MTHIIYEIASGLIVNTWNGSAPPDGWEPPTGHGYADAPDWAQVGHSWSNGALVIPPPPEPGPDPVPPEISDVQFALEWAARGVITRAEALEFVRTGTIPAAFQAALDAIPDADARFAAEMRVSGSTVYRRSHPDTIALSTAFGLDAAATDQFFRDAAQR